MIAQRVAPTVIAMNNKDEQNEEFEDRLRHRFRNSELLRRALTHS